MGFAEPANCRPKAKAKATHESATSPVHHPRQTEGVTGSYQNWLRGETREAAAQKGTTGRQEERLKGPRAEAAGCYLAPRPQTSNQITAPRRSTRTLQRVKCQEAAKQQTAKGSNRPEPQGNPQGALSLQETKRERHVRGQSQACCIAAGMFTTKHLSLSGRPRQTEGVTGSHHNWRRKRTVQHQGFQKETEQGKGRGLQGSRQTDRGGYREPPELAEGETREAAAQKGTTGRQEERLKGPRKRHVRGQSQACCIAAGMFTTNMSSARR